MRNRHYNIWLVNQHIWAGLGLLQTVAQMMNFRTLLQSIQTTIPFLDFFFTNTFIHKTLNPQCTFYLTYMYVDNVLIYQQSVFKISFQPPKEMNCNQLFPRSYHKPVHRKDWTDKKRKIDMISTAFIHQKKVFTKLYAK